MKSVIRLIKREKETPEDTLPPPDAAAQRQQEALGKAITFGFRRKAARSRRRKATREKQTAAAEPVPEPAREPAPAEESTPLALICLGVCVIGSFVLILIILLFSRQLADLVRLGEDRRSCRGADCLEAKRISQKMNSDKIEPCYDFYLYSCGAWFETHTTSTSSIDVLSNIVMSSLNRTIYEHVLGDPNKDRFHGMVTFYRSCYEFQRERHPMPVLQPQIFEALGVIMREWIRQTDHASILDSIVRLSMTKGIDTIYSIKFVDDDGLVRLKLAPAVSVRRKLLYDDEVATHTYFEIYMEGFMYHVDRNFFDLNLQYTLLAIDSDYDDAVGFDDDIVTEVVDVTSLTEVAGVLTVSDWISALNRGIQDDNRKLKPTDKVLMINRQGVRRVTELLFRQSPLHLALYVILQASGNMLRFDFNRVLSPHHTCLLHTYEAFDSAFTTLVANTYVGQSRIRYFRAFFERVRSQMVEDLSTKLWLDAPTRRTTQVRVQAVGLEMILPDTAGLLLRTPQMGSNFLKNYVAMLGHHKREINKFPRRRGTSVGRDYRESLIRGWAKYVADRNVITVPTTMLMAPAFYDIDEDSFINYSAVGSTFLQLLSTVITGEDEYVTPLWLRQAQDIYNSSVTCYTNQFTNLHKDKRTLVPQERSLLFATARSVLLAYRFANPPDTLARKLFFGRLCQLRCNTDFDTSPAILPARALCDFALQNMPSFFETFKCSDSDRMKPQSTCNII
ncbi:neprilysin-1-like [Ornithodoros turicata]|uniref:neprilysin-1-like n=1 Tax=Ornithodoros turicata TaxID=34597 RepID=UPI0031392883